jgi:anti-anti-sigma factor
MISAGQPPIGRPTRFGDHRNGCRVLRLTGSLDINNRDAVDRELRGHIEAVASSVTIVDLSAVTFIDAAGLDPLLRAHVELAELERVLAVQSISAPVTRLFRLLAGIRPHGLIRETLRTCSAPVGARPEAAGPDQDLPGRHARHLQADLRAHALLNEATGLLMAVHDCNADQARLLLELVGPAPRCHGRRAGRRNRRRDRRHPDEPARDRPRGDGPGRRPSRAEHPRPVARDRAGIRAVTHAVCPGGNTSVALPDGPGRSR